MSISIVALCEMGKLSIETIVIGILHKKTTNFYSSNRIVVVKRKYIFEVETPPQHPICPPMRHSKPIEAVSFV